MLYTKQEVLEFVKLGYYNAMLSGSYTRKEPDAEGKPVEEARCIPFYFLSFLFNEEMTNDIKELEKFCMETKEDVRLELKLFLDKDMTNPSDTVTVTCVLPTKQREALESSNIDVFKMSVRCMLKEIVNALIARGNKK